MVNRNSKKALAPLLIISAASCWGCIGLFTRPLAAAGLTSAQIAFLRSAISAVLVWLFLAVFDRQKLKVQLSDLWLFVGTGVLSLVLFSVLYFTAQQLTGLSAASVLLYTAPCFVMIMSAIFFHEIITGRKILALGLAFAGCICTTGLLSSLFVGGGGLSTAGILCGIGSGLGYALYSIFGNAALKKYSSVTVTAYTFLFSALALMPFCLRGSLFSALGDSSVIKTSLLLSLLSTIAPYLLYTAGLSLTQPGKASVMAFAEPVVATLVGVAVFGERLTASGIAGIALIFISLIILNTGKAHAENTCPACEEKNFFKEEIKP